MKNLMKLFSVIMVMCMVFSLCACVDGNEPADDDKTETTVNKETEKETEAETEKAAAFKVKVVDANGEAVVGVVLQICKDSCIPARTGDDGVATFNIEITEGHKLSVMSCPTGYEYNGEAEVYLESGITEYTLEVTKVG